MNDEARKKLFEEFIDIQNRILLAEIERENEEKKKQEQTKNN